VIAGALVDAFGATGIVAGALVTLGILAGGFIKVGLGFYRWTRRIEASIGYVEAEMRFNGGSTIRDAVARIERRQSHIEQSLGHLAEEEEAE